MTKDTEMTAAEFKRIAIAFYGLTYQSDMAKALETSERSIHRYATGERAISDAVRKKLVTLAGKRVAEITKAVAA